MSKQTRDAELRARFVHLTGQAQPDMNNKFMKATGWYFRRSHIALPVALCFGVGSIIYSFTWARDRHDNPVCIDCDRQKQMVQEVYFDHRVKTPAHVVKQAGS